MTAATAAPVPSAADPAALRRALARASRRRKWRAFGLTLPLLLFLLLTFLVPIAALLKRAVENPEVVRALPRTVVVLQDWKHEDVPRPEAFAAIVADLGALSD